MAARINQHELSLNAQEQSLGCYGPDVSGPWQQGRRSAFGGHIPPSDSGERMFNGMVEIIHCILYLILAVSSIYGIIPC